MLTKNLGFLTLFYPPQTHEFRRVAESKQMGASAPAPVAARRAAVVTGGECKWLVGDSRVQSSPPAEEYGVERREVVFCATHPISRRKELQRKNTLFRRLQTNAKSHAKTLIFAKGKISPQSNMKVHRQV